MIALRRKFGSVTLLTYEAGAGAAGRPRVMIPLAART